MPAAVPENVILAPSVNVLPSVGAVIVTVGGVFALTVTVIDALAVNPMESLTEAVIVWFPTERTAEKEPPVPMAPSREEVQARLAVRSPSSASVAVPAKLMLVPSANVLPSSGAVMVTVGDVFELTVTVIESLPAKPPESVTKAVIVWVPTERTAEKEPPVPMAPSRDDVQVRLPVRTPSSGSVAVPAKRMLVPSVKVLPLGGAITVTVGGVFGLTVTVIESLPAKPPESVTKAVIVWVPTERTVKKEPPEPMFPSMEDDQERLDVRSPSSASVAVPAKLIVSPSPKMLPSGGAVMVAVGGVFCSVTTSQRRRVHCNTHIRPSLTVIVPSWSASRGSSGPLAGVFRAIKMALISFLSIAPFPSTSQTSACAGWVKTRPSPRATKRIIPSIFFRDDI